jgi:hypothetical protein
MNNPATAKDYGEGREHVSADERRKIVDMRMEEAPDMLSEPEAPDKKAARPLASYRVDHCSTLSMTWEEIEALRKPFIIDNFLRQGELLLLAAESKSRKSWTAQDMGFAVGCHTPWLPYADGSGGFATKPGRVHVLDLELNADEMKFRYAKARGNRFTDDRTAAAALSENTFAYSLDGLGAEQIMVLVDELEPLVKPGDLVIVDCFYRMQPDGNDPAPVAAILERFKRFAAATLCGVVIVDHFRKAGDDKARNRIAGSFVKMASPSTLVSVEVKDDILTMNVDARTFHGCPVVNARFDLDTYAFVRVADEEMEEAKNAAAEIRDRTQLKAIYTSRLASEAFTTADALRALGVKSKQGAAKRLKALQKVGLVEEADAAPGTPTKWKITTKGTLFLQS